MHSKEYHFYPIFVLATNKYHNTQTDENHYFTLYYWPLLFHANTIPPPWLPKKTSHTQEANRLVAEARNLWLPPLTSTFFFFNDSEHISINDKEIWAKLDSALAIDPTNIKVYGKNQLFISLQKYHEILSVPPASWKQSTLNADLWSMKAMFEDYFETALPPKKIIGLPIPPMPSLIKRICYRQPQVCWFLHQPRTEHGIDDW